MKATDSADLLEWRRIIAYGAPGVGAGYMYLLLTLYVMKFSTDVLLIAPAVMGTIFGISRIWDAVSDPLAGYFSDRTLSRLGRRRSWLLASILPIAISFVMVFSPPSSLVGTGLSLWMALAIILFYSAMTVFIVPHMSLGAELTSNYHERSRLYGLRHIAFTAGSILALISMQIFINAEREGAAVVRDRTFELSLFAAFITAGLIAYAVINLRERPDFQGRATGNPFLVLAHIWKNVHARLLMIVTFIENVGGAAIGVLTLYVAQYVIGRPELGPLIILTYMIPSTVTVPIWIPLSRRLGKVRLWIYSMLVTATAFGAMLFLPFVEQDTRVAMIFIAAVFAGSAAGCGGTLGPSVESDIIDFDELTTGDRKEGSYFAAWNFVYKGATGVMIILTGYVLQLSGFMPNQVQPFNVQLAIVALYGLFPLTCYILGAWLFTRFTLDEAEYTRIRAGLDGARERADMTATSDMVGALLCGGSSSRMGTDKALLEMRPGVRQLDYTLGLLNSVCGEVVACVGPGERDKMGLADGVTAIRDAEDIEGPMAGIIAALEAAGGRAVLALACDMPYLDEELLKELVAGRDAGKLATAFVAADGKPEPMCAIYEAASLGPLTQLARAHRGSLRAFLDNSLVQLIRPDQPGRLASVNDPNELESARRQLCGPDNV